MGAHGFRSRVSLGLGVDPLRINERLHGSAMEEALAMEALRRGAKELDLIRLLERWRREQQRSQTGGLFSKVHYAAGPLSLTLDLYRQLDIWPHIESYRQMVRQEFANLPADVHKSFAYGGRDALLCYFEMRPVYYRVGYSWPARDIFSKIGPAKLLGHQVAGGVHEMFLDKLNKVEALLNRWSTGLAGRMAGEIHGIGGFVPRYIAPTKGAPRRAPVLSNHAFGLAIDIDPRWNPHIKGAEVIEALKEVTGYDFGKSFVEYSKDIPPIDRAAQTHLLEQDASNRLQGWLKTYLPIYKSIDPEASIPSGRRGGKPAEKPKPEEPGAVEVCEPLDAETARQMVRIQVLRKSYRLSELEEWANHGIQTIPLSLAAALTEVGCRWGATYEHSKDVMHFELEAKNVLPPDSGPRPLESILQLTEMATMRKA